MSDTRISGSPANSFRDQAHNGEGVTFGGGAYLNANSSDSPEPPANTKFSPKRLICVAIVIVLVVLLMFLVWPAGETEGDKTKLPGAMEKKGGKEKETGLKKEASSLKGTKGDVGKKEQEKNEEEIKEEDKKEGEVGGEEEKEEEEQEAGKEEIKEEDEDENGEEDEKEKEGEEGEEEENEENEENEEEEEEEEEDGEEDEEEESDDESEKFSQAGNAESSKPSWKAKLMKLVNLAKKHRKYSIAIGSSSFFFLITVCWLFFGSGDGGGVSVEGTALSKSVETKQTKKGMSQNNSIIFVAARIISSWLLSFGVCYFFYDDTKSDSLKKLWHPHFLMDFIIAIPLPFAMSLFKFGEEFKLYIGMAVNFIGRGIFIYVLNSDGWSFINILMSVLSSLDLVVSLIFDVVRLLDKDSPVFTIVNCFTSDLLTLLFSFIGQFFVSEEIAKSEESSSLMKTEPFISHHLIEIVIVMLKYHWRPSENGDNKTDSGVAAGGRKNNKPKSGSAVKPNVKPGVAQKQGGKPAQPVDKNVKPVDKTKTGQLVDKNVKEKEIKTVKQGKLGGKDGNETHFVKRKDGKRVRKGKGSAAVQVQPTSGKRRTPAR